MQTTNDVFVGQNAAKYVRLMQLQVKLKKITEITYLEENKQETRYSIKHLDVSKEEQTYDDVSKTKESMKIKCYVFSGYKHRNNVCFVYLESQLQKNGYGWSVFKLKSVKTVEKTYLETSKQQAR